MTYHSIYVFGICTSYPHQPWLTSPSLGRVANTNLTHDILKVLDGHPSKYYPSSTLLNAIIRFSMKMGDEGEENNVRGWKMSIWTFEVGKKPFQFMHSRGSTKIVGINSETNRLVNLVIQLVFHLFVCVAPHTTQGPVVQVVTALHLPMWWEGRSD